MNIGIRERKKEGMKVDTHFLIKSLKLGRCPLLGAEIYMWQWCKMVEKEENE